ncbi:hypothetical protein GALL_41380 [mine drainage metagenome]|uniref:Uncharacterized protein n=1 Tax=mine drainage metagenome TaxID=410659 RepID=A0A1J5TMT9_9ZZZZ
METSPKSRTCLEPSSNLQAQHTCVFFVTFVGFCSLQSRPQATGLAVPKCRRMASAISASFTGFVM